MTLDCTVGVIRTATVSVCGRYRYRLARTWDEDRPPLAFLMLNPSVADHRQDDPTIRRCIGFAAREGCGGIVVVNLFAFRTTYPRHLLGEADPVGPDNDRHIVEVAAQAGRLVVAWGGIRKRHQPRAKAVLKLLGGRPLWCLGKTVDGNPRHPLMLASDTQLEVYP